MDVQDLCKGWRKAVGRINEYGIPVPTARDPKSGKGSASFTLVVLSSSLVIMGIVGKWAGVAGGIDIENALQFFYACAGLYFGRQWQKAPKKKPDSAPSVDNPDDPGQ